MLTATGLGSGLDIEGLVTQLVASERAISDIQLNRESTKITSKFSALGSLKGALGGFDASLSSLTSASKFESKKASSSDADSIAVTVNSLAVPNSYAVSVSQLAESHALVSSAFADDDTTQLGTGTLTIRKGSTDYDSGTDTYNSFTENSDFESVTINIDSSNNTLQGIAEAINDSDAEINASVVNDGSGFRLLLSSAATGADNSLEIVVDDDDSNDTDTLGLSRLAFNAAATNLEQTNEALDAQLNINGLSVSSANNTVDMAIEGLTLDLNKVTTGDVTITVDADFTSVIAAVNSFVAGYNQFATTANSLSAFNADTEIAGPLLGDFTLRSITQQVDSIVRGSITNISGSVTSLTQLGVTTNSDGLLELDESTLSQLLESDPDNVADLFASIATPDDADIVFNSVGTETTVGTYAVNISQMASAGSYTGSGVLPDFGGGGTLTIDGDNDNLTLEIDGIDIGEISLSHNTYTTGNDLAAELQAQINAAETLVSAGGSVVVSYDSGSDSLTIQSGSEGSYSTVNILAVDTNSIAELGIDSGNGTAGLDVAGTIGGEAATGTGNILIADEGTVAEGLSLTITGGTTGARGDVVFTRGYASQLEVLFNQILDEEGALETRLDSFEGRLEEINDRRESLELRWEALEERYRQQFNTLDILLANLNSTSTFLQNQLDNIASITQRDDN